MSGLRSVPLAGALTAAAGIWMIFSHNRKAGPGLQSKPLQPESQDDVTVVLEQLVAHEEPTMIVNGKMKFHHHYVVLDKTATSEVLCAELNLPRWKEAKINGSILSTLKGGHCHIPVMEVGRSASSDFWMSIKEPLKAFLASLPGTLAGMGFIPPIKAAFEDDCAWMYQVQYLSGRAAFYWHQDIRWKQHWDVVLFMYMSDDPVVTEIVCPDREYVATPGEPGGSKGQPEIAKLADDGSLPIIAPAMKPGQLFVMNNRKVWHRSPLGANDKGLNTLLTVRMKFPAMRK